MSRRSIPMYRYPLAHHDPKWNHDVGSFGWLRAFRIEDEDEYILRPDTKANRRTSSVLCMAVMVPDRDHPNGRCMLVLPVQPCSHWPFLNSGKHWQWDGNQDRPTLSPVAGSTDIVDAFIRTSGHGWHGYIRNGELITL